MKVYIQDENLIWKERERERERERGKEDKIESKGIIFVHHQCLKGLK
jgi:hypothetical protein